MKKLIILALAASAAFVSCGRLYTLEQKAADEKVIVGFCPSGMSASTQGFYRKCLGDAGADSLVFFSEYVSDRKTARAYIRQVDALITPGSTSNDAKGRGASEDLLIKEALRRHKPVLGICYGHQHVNIVKGGANSSVKKLAPDTEILHRNVVDGHNVGINHKEHNINIADGSRLQEMLGGVDTIGVNTSHRYAIGKIGKGVKVTATADDGIIESIQGKGFIGVQFHPEYLYGKHGMEPFLGIFKAFVGDAKVARYKRGH